MTGVTGAVAVLAELDHCIRGKARALRLTTERDLQDSLAELLGSEGYAAEREKALGPGERPDFLTGGIAVEVKINGTAGELERQVRRYLAYREVTGVLVVTSRARHRRLPPVIDGKPVLVTWVVSPF